MPNKNFQKLLSGGAEPQEPNQPAASATPVVPRRHIAQEDDMDPTSLMNVGFDDEEEEDITPLQQPMTRSESVIGKLKQAAEESASEPEPADLSAFTPPEVPDPEVEPQTEPEPEPEPEPPRRRRPGPKPLAERQHIAETEEGAENGRKQEGTKSKEHEHVEAGKNALEMDGVVDIAEIVLDYVCKKCVDNLKSTYKSKMYTQEFMEGLFQKYLDGEIQDGDPLFVSLVSECIENADKDPYLGELTTPVLRHIKGEV